MNNTINISTFQLTQVFMVQLQTVFGFGMSNVS